MTYQEEIDWIVTNPERNEFITNLTSNLKGNTLVLFQFVEKHGKPLFEMIKERCPDRKCFFVYGGTDVDAREEVRRIGRTRGLCYNRRIVRYIQYWYFYSATT